MISHVLLNRFTLRQYEHSVKKTPKICASKSKYPFNEYLLSYMGYILLSKLLNIYKFYMKIECGFIIKKHKINKGIDLLEYYMRRIFF